MSAATECPLDSWEDYRNAVLDLLAGARTNLVVFDPTLEETGLESPRGVELLVALAKRSSREDAIRVLVRDTAFIERDCPRLQRVFADFSHRITLRALTPDQQIPDNTFTIADNVNLALLFHFASPRGRVNLDDGLAADPLAQFETLWEFSGPGPNYVSLGL
ncbi:MAG: hypothetical protein LBB76_09215 [Azoarcus sp.]|jgi:hypothetical protein|nr:hypothetical protein [Azoarcus sp.]